MTKTSVFRGHTIKIGAVALAGVMLLVGCDDKKKENTSANAGAASVGEAAPGSTPPAPKMLVVDRAAILRGSKVGQDIARQVQAYSQQAQSDLKQREQALVKERDALTQQLAIASASVKAQKQREWESKASSLQQLEQKKQAQIQNGILAAQTKVEQALGPILKQAMEERGGNLLLDRNAIIMSTVDINITQAVIDKLDQAMPAVKVELLDEPPQQQSVATPPAGK